ncbi:hypothetical protein ACMBCM_02555 [Spiroplasma sp. K1]
MTWNGAGEERENSLAPKRKNNCLLLNKQHTATAHLQSEADGVVNK